MNERKVVELSPETVALLRKMIKSLKRQPETRTWSDIAEYLTKELRMMGIEAEIRPSQVRTLYYEGKWIPEEAYFDRSKRWMERYRTEEEFRKKHLERVREREKKMKEWLETAKKAVAEGKI
jgi:cysteinyl-tRNA synthetase